MKITLKYFPSGDELERAFPGETRHAAASIMGEIFANGFTISALDVRPEHVVVDSGTKYGVVSLPGGWFATRRKRSKLLGYAQMQILKALVTFGEYHHLCGWKYQNHWYTERALKSLVVRELAHAATDENGLVRYYPTDAGAELVAKSAPST